MRVAAKRTDTENLFEILANQSPVGLYIVQDGKFCYTNPAFQDTTGYREDKLLGRDALGLVVPEDREMVRENAIKMLKGERTLPYQLRVIHKNGSIKWIMESVVSIQYRGRRATLGNFVDITDRKQAEEALQAERNKLQSLIDALEYTLTIQDPEYNIIYQNEPSRIASAGDHVGEKCYRAYEGRECICEDCPVERAFKDGKSHTAERRTVIEGKVAFWENTATPIRDAKGRIVACLELARDITERKQAEEMLQAEKNKLQSLIDAMEDHLTIRDRDYNLIYLSERVKKIWGDHTGEKCYRAFEGQEKVCDECPAEEAFKDAKSHTTERKTVLPSGEVAFWENTVNPIRDAEGSVVACLELARNITERKKQEQALADEATRRRILVDQSLDGIVVLDVDARVVEANQRFAEMLGYTPEEVRELHTWDWDKNFPPEKILEMGRNANEKGFHLETKHTRKDGSVIDVDISINSATCAGQKLIFCVCRDVTARNQAEKALKTERNKLQSLVDAMEDGLTIQDMDYNIVYQNESLRKAYGDRLGEKCYQVYEGRETVCDECPMEQAFKDGKSHTSVRSGVLLSGEVSFAETTANPIRDADGKIVSCIEIVRNITERKKAEEQLQESEQYLKTLFNASGGGILVIDTETHDIVDANSTIIKMIGIERDQIIGRKCHKFVCSAEVGKCPITDLGQKVDSAERTLLKANGEGIPVIKSVVPITRHGRQYLLELIVDVTERKRAEQALADELTRRRLLVDQSLDGIVVIDENDKVYEANQRFAEMLGYTMEEIRELHTWDWDKNFSHEQIHELGKKADEKGFLLETTHTRKDGSVIDVDIGINASMFGGQKLIFCVCRDVTARKQAEKAFQAEKNKLQSLIDAMTDALTIQDTEYNIIFQNEPSRKSTGGDRIGEKCYWVYEGRESICEDCPVEKVFKDGKPRTVERQRLISGEVTFWENTANPIRDATGKVVSCLEIGRNVTERKKQEQTLADELTQHHLLIDKSLDGIVVLDVDARVVEANQRFADMLGYTMEEVRELHTWDWDKQFPPEKILEMGRNVDEKGFHLETKHTRKDGSVIDVDISISGIMYGGRKLIFCIQRDVTERNRIEKALKDSEEGYKELANSITNVFFAMDEHLRYTYWNKASEILTGVRAEDALGKFLSEIFPDSPELRSAEKVYRNVLRTQQSQIFVNDFDINGRHYTFEISAYPSKGGLSVFARDITERKEMEEAINLQRAHFQQLFDNSPDAIIMMDTNDRAIQVNKGFEALFGYSNEEVKGRTLIELIIPEVDVQEASASLQRIVGGEVVRKESVRRRKDGSLVDVSVLAYPIFSNGKLIGSYAIYSNITERKQAEEAIKRAAEEWRKTFDSISDAISIHDKNFRILRANKAFADLFKKDPRQIIGRHCYEFHKVEKPISGCPHQQTLATGKPAATEFYESRLERYFRESTSPLFNEKGKVIGTVHIARDITEQKQQSARLALADRLASLGELAAGTAHELNNPLTSVIGFSQLLMEKDIPDDVREDVKLIYNEARRAADVTKNLLTFARKRAPVKQLTQINNAIEDVLKLRAYEQKVNSIEVKKQLAHDLPEIMVDYYQMQQVFLNIIINAEYFMTEAHNRGTLTITTKKHNSSVRISFADDGPGIPEENLNRIFDPFFTTKEPGKGTGLGLSICHGIVAEHGGQVYAKSQLGKGATFVVELPFKSP